MLKVLINQTCPIIFRFALGSEFCKFGSQVECEPSGYHLMHFPYFSGVHLKDLVLLHTALPDKVDGNLINFRKMAQLSIIFSELMKLQTASLPVEPNMDMASMMRVGRVVVGGGMVGGLGVHGQHDEGR